MTSPLSLYPPQSVRDLILGGLGITNLTGLENLGRFDELSIVNNMYLTTLRTLGENLPPGHRSTINNLGLRDNPLLVDVDGLWFIEQVNGECELVRVEEVGGALWCMPYVTCI